MQGPKNHERSRSATCTISRGGSRSRGRAESSRPSRSPRARRRGLARLRCAYFSRAGESASRYGVGFETVVAQIWRARRAHPRLLLRQVAHIEDLVQAIACASGNGRAWADFAEQHERTLARRCRDCRDELEATVQVRKFIATLRRDALAGHSMLWNYAGTRPLRTWLGEAFQTTRQRTRRASFVLDPADSCCGAPLRFTRAGS
jgi:hypothetical protein